MMDMMKKMYSEGDDEMKRTIAKSWVISFIKFKLFSNKVQTNQQMED